MATDDGTGLGRGTSNVAPLLLEGLLVFLQSTRLILQYTNVVRRRHAASQ